jgi:hypothetical protein
MTIDEILYALLYRRSFRQRFARGEREALGIGTREAADLAAVDLRELERSARLACRGILTRSHRGVGDLRAAFPRTIAAWTDAHAGGFEELAMTFAESTSFDAYRALPASGAISLEEAFYRFAEAEGIGRADVRQLEFAHALMRALAVTKRPAFRLPTFIRRTLKGHFAVIGWNLVAALDGHLITGPVTPFVAAILDASESPETIVAKFQVSADEASQVIAQMRTMGLLESLHTSHGQLPGRLDEETERPRALGTTGEVEEEAGDRGRVGLEHPP